MGFRDMNQRQGMNGGNQKLDEILGSYLFPWGDAQTKQYFRLHGPILAYEFYWFDIVGKKGTAARVPKMCIDLDPYTDTYISDDCPYRASGLGSKSRFYLVNGIWRKQQDNEPKNRGKLRASEKKLQKVIDKAPGFEKGWEAYMLDLAGGSESWTPNRVLNLSARNSLTIAEMSKDNVYKGKDYDVTDPDHGCDVCIKYDPKGTGTGKFQITRDDESGMTPLSDEEMDFLVIKHDVLTFMTPKEAQADWKEFKTIIVKDSDKPKDGEGMRGRGRSSASKLDEDVDDDTPRSRSRPRDLADEEAEDRNERKPARTAAGGARSRLAARRPSRSNRDEDLPF